MVLNKENLRVELIIDVIALGKRDDIGLEASECAAEGVEASCIGKCITVRKRITQSEPDICECCPIWIPDITSDRFRGSKCQGEVSPGLTCAEIVILAIWRRRRRPAKDRRCQGVVSA